MGHHPLAGIVAKLRRSDEHIVTLYNEAARYQNTNPHHLRGHRDTGKGKPGFTLHFAKQPPLYFAVIIGDAVHNLRSAIDYIAHELTVRNGALPTRKTQFPIGLTEDDFLNQAITLKKLNTVSIKALKIVSAFQPYRMDADKTRVHPLYQLTKLSNMDKHHTLALSAIAVEMTFTFTHPDGRQIVSAFKDGAVHDGAVVATMPAAFFHEKIETHIKGSSTIAFKDAPLTDRDTVAVLQSIREFIGQLILPAIEPFFDPLPDNLRLKSHGLPPEILAKVTYLGRK
ncbi:MAG: hypothetical protein HY657_17450 [Acidobacteria bacterium]|nr:hypothetical protein [Acidobacteriota bacterium]